MATRTVTVDLPHGSARRSASRMTTKKNFDNTVRLAKTAIQGTYYVTCPVI